MKKLKLLTLSIFLLLFSSGCTQTPVTSEGITETPVTTEVKAWEGSTSDYDSFDISMVPEYDGNPAAIIHDNVPFFTTEEISDIPFETYSPLDELGRCQTAYANICKELMPTEEREGIGYIKPTGWKQAKYDTKVTGMDSPYLYNRCHLIAFELAGENANEQNLITGTRYMNVSGMLPYENQVAKYVRQTGHHVLYRVTPVFAGDELVVRGVLIEAASVEDNDCIFCVYCYNVCPGVTIDYQTGDSEGPEFTGSDVRNEEPVVHDETGLFYWTENGNCYHKDKNCSSLKNSKNIESGSMEDCPKEKACKLCGK